MTDFTGLPLSDTEMFLRNPDAYRKADRALALMESIECGPVGKSCDLDAPCPAHGGDRREDEDWTAQDEAALVIFEQRFGAEVTRTTQQLVSDGPMPEAVPSKSRISLSDPTSLPSNAGEGMPAELVAFDHDPSCRGDEDIYCVSTCPVAKDIERRVSTEGIDV